MEAAFLQVPYVINWGSIDRLALQLHLATSDIDVMLHCLSKILSNVGGQLEAVKKRLEDDYLAQYPNGETTDKIEELQWSVNDDESRLSYHIMEDYYG